MKHLIIFLFLLLLSSSLLTGQVVISEIMYNPPESGTDSLEYIELYNPSDAEVDLSGYVFSAGIDFIFPDTSIAPQGYFLIAGNADAMVNALGITAIGWDGNALSNGGESVILLDADSTVVDEVEYDDSSPWPRDDEGTDGAGASIEFCIEKDDNSKGENWRASKGATDLVINERAFFGTPGVANSATCLTSTADHIVVVTSNVFTLADLTIKVGETVQWKNEGGNHNVNGSLDKFPDNPEGFGNGAASPAAWEYEFTFTKAGFYDYQCDPHANFGMTGTVTVVSEETFKDLTIAEATAVDIDGQLLNIEDSVRVSGIAYGVNFSRVGLEFTLIDEDNEGIAIYSASDDFDYNYMEGDSLILTGTLAHYNGLGQLNLTGVELVNSGNDLLLPTTVTALSENTESSLIMIEDVSLVDSTQWTNDGFSFSVDVTNGTDTFSLVVDEAVADLYGGGYPTGTFDVTGIGGQFDDSFPYTSGYQIWPRYIADISPYQTTVAQYPLTSVEDASAIDENGEAAMDGKKVEIKGVTHGINFRPAGLQFTIIDENDDGIGLFLNSGDLDYSFAEGDLISVKGSISQFNGLTQIEPDFIDFESAGNDLSTAEEVTELNEDTESQLVKIVAGTVVDPSQWTPTGGSFNVDVKISDDVTITMRIDSDTDLADKPLPGNTLMITGIGGQFDNDAPFLQGYQIFPRYQSDIQVVSSVGAHLLPDNLVSIYPNPTSNLLVIEHSLEVSSMLIYDDLGRIVFNVNAAVSSIDISSYTRGKYYIQFNTDWGIVQKAFVKI